MKKKQTLKFVECKTTPGIQIWGYGSTIYHKCLCGKELSYDTPGVETHWIKYEIAIPHRLRANFEELTAKIAASRETYQVSDWTEVK